MAGYESDPKVVKKLEEARAKLAKYKQKVLTSRGEELKKYQKLEKDALAECLKWYDRL